MREKFRNWKMQDTLKITYEVNKVKKVWSGSQKTLLSAIIQTVSDYHKMDIKLTNRQLYYQLVKANIIPNAQEIYKRICVFLTDCRYAGIVDWEAIEDRAREAVIHPEWNTVKDIVDSAIQSYRLPRWADQDFYVELYCEKDAMTSVFEPVSNKYHIHFTANKGYSSAAAMYETAQRFKDKIGEGIPTRLLYFGDHDPSGLDMIRDIEERVCEFLLGGKWPLEEEDVADQFKIIPVALNMIQINDHDCPPNPMKVADPRAAWYFKKHGPDSWELDALPPQVLRVLAEQAILQFLDLDQYNAVIAHEDSDKEALITFADTLI